MNHNSDYYGIDFSEYDDEDEVRLEDYLDRVYAPNMDYDIDYSYIEDYDSESESDEDYP